MLDREFNLVHGDIVKLRLFARKGYGRRIFTYVEFFCKFRFGNREVFSRIRKFQSAEITTYFWQNLAVCEFGFVQRNGYRKRRLVNRNRADGECYVVILCGILFA